MTVTWKPDGYPTVSPYLLVPDAARAIRFIVDVFDAEEIRRFEDPNGRIMHAEVRLDESVIMIGESTDAWKPIPSYVHVYVPDVNATYRRALARGAESVQEPTRKDDDDRRGGVSDPDGTTWWIGTKEK